MTTENENEIAVQYRRRRKGPSFWKDGIEYRWNPKKNQYERWITAGGRRICVPLDNGFQPLKNITTKEYEALLQFAIDSGDEELYFNIKKLFSSNKEGDYEQAFSLYQEPNHGAPTIATSVEYIEQIDLERIEKYQEQGARTRSNRAQRHAELRNEMMVLKRNERELVSQIELYENLDQDQMRDLGEADINAIRKMLGQVQSRLKVISEDTKSEMKARINDRDSVGERLRILFPNRGGKELLNEDTQRKIRKLFAKHNRKNIAIQIIEVYNAIGRCYNLRGRDFDQPSVSFGIIEKEEGDDPDAEIWGRFKNNVITLNEKLLNKSPRWLLVVFAHELGHWLEYTVCKTGYDNQQWLLEKQGNFIPKGKHKIAPFDKRPMLCADDYAQVVRDDGTELISVAMQELVADPEIFARRCSDHFDQLLNNFKEI